MYIVSITDDNNDQLHRPPDNKFCVLTVFSRGVILSAKGGDLAVLSVDDDEGQLHIPVVT